MNAPPIARPTRKLARVKTLLGTLAAIVALESNGTLAQQAQSVREPDRLSASARDGKILFNRNCAVCHGESAAGTEQGPPLVHDIYNPGHHGDESFVRAAKNGVRAHHWPFGDMPPVPGVTEPMVRAIVKYVRALQAENGIVTSDHRM